MNGIGGTTYPMVLPLPAARQIRVAVVTNAELAELVCAHRDNAGRAARLFKRPVDQARYAAANNRWADIFQELLDRRRDAP